MKFKTAICVVVILAAVAVMTARTWSEIPMVARDSDGFTQYDLNGIASFDDDMTTLTITKPMLYANMYDPTNGTDLTGYLKTDGSRDMDEGYDPVNAQSVMTKSYADFHYDPTNGTGSTVGSLEDLSDVAMEGALANREVLSYDYNESIWENRPIYLDDVDNVFLSPANPGGNIGDHLFFNGTSWLNAQAYDPTNGTIEALMNVTGTPSDGDFLIYSGTAWDSITPDINSIDMP
jgi:hypothetical protein